MSDHLVRHKIKQMSGVYAERLVSAGVDSPADFDGMSEGELRARFKFKDGDLKKVKAARRRGLDPAPSSSASPGVRPSPAGGAAAASRPQKRARAATSGNVPLPTDMELAELRGKAARAGLPFGGASDTAEDMRLYGFKLESDSVSVTVVTKPTVPKVKSDKATQERGLEPVHFRRGGLTVCKCARCVATGKHRGLDAKPACKFSMFALRVALAALDALDSPSPAERQHAEALRAAIALPAAASPEEISTSFLWTSVLQDAAFDAVRHVVEKIGEPAEDADGVRYCHDVLADIMGSEPKEGLRPRLPADRSAIPDSLLWKACVTTTCSACFEDMQFGDVKSLRKCGNMTVAHTVHEKCYLAGKSCSLCRQPMKGDVRTDDWSDAAGNANAQKATTDTLRMISLPPTEGT